MYMKGNTIPFAKVVNATDEDMKDFQGFVNRLELDPEARQSGLVKVKAR